MIPYAFTYRKAASIAEAEKLLAGTPEAKLLAGGQSLIPAMKTRLAAPTMLVDISGLREICFIRAEADALFIGAGIAHAVAAESEIVTRAIPALAALAETIGDPAVRHRGTLGGAVANADPAADYPAALLALDATIVTSQRRIPVEAFFTGLFATAIAESEIVTGISFAVPERAGYAKFRNPASRYAMAGVFVAKSKAGVRVVVTGAGSNVFRLPEMEAALEKNFRPEAVAGIAVDARDLNADLHGSAEYRAHLVGVMAKRAVNAALTGEAVVH